MKLTAAEKRDRLVWAIEVFDGVEWRRMQAKYRTRRAARGWLTFAKNAWHARHGRTVAIASSLRDGLKGQHGT